MQPERMKRSIAMFKRKEVVVRDQPALAVEPEVVERTVFVEDKRPRFLLGLVLGAVLLAGGVAVFANHEGSYQTAGANADQALAQAQQTTESVTSDATTKIGAATENAGDAIETQTDKLAPSSQP
jgi:hypothetical protein